MELLDGGGEGPQNGDRQARNEKIQGQQIGAGQNGSGHEGAHREPFSPLYRLGLLPFLLGFSLMSEVLWSLNV